MLINKKRFLSVLAFSYQFAYSANENENMSLLQEVEEVRSEGVAVKNEQDNIEVSQVSVPVEHVVAQQKYRDLTQSEMESFRQALSEEDIEQLKNFIESFQKNISSVQDTEQIQKLEDICKKHGISLRIMIQLVPTVLVTESNNDVVLTDETVVSA